MKLQMHEMMNGLSETLLSLESMYNQGSSKKAVGRPSHLKCLNTPEVVS